jgi:two-component system cell cycle sensor histidine kinase/response regulator CckA
MSGWNGLPQPPVVQPPVVQPPVAQTLVAQTLVAQTLVARPSRHPTSGHPTPGHSTPVHTTPVHTTQGHPIPGTQPKDDAEQERRLQVVGQLAGGIAHDFNNLLTAILGAADAIVGRAETSGETVADVQQIRRGVERGAALVRQLLAFSRQQTLQPRVVAVNAAIEDAARLLHRLLGAKIALTLELERPGRRVMVDPGQLDQVLLNLAVNARDAMAEGGRLTLASGHATLYRPRLAGPETIPAGRYVTITVADSGLGIASAVMPRIFEPFFTTKRTPGTSGLGGIGQGGTGQGGTGQGGNGLGLPSVLGIVRQSGGFLEVASQVGIGTKVVVYLPRYAAGEADPVPPRPPAPATAPAVPGGAGRVVLVVEDEAPVRLVLARALVRAGWRVLAAETAESALEMLQSPAESPDSQPSVVISDVVMPGMDGPALVRAVRRICPGIPAVLVSGYAEPVLRQELVTADIAFLAKPYVTAELLDLVARLARAEAPEACPVAP